MNIITTGAGFRDFSSKLREQAKKLPSFDDMAAKDDYIHSEEFNVRSNNTATTSKREEGGSTATAVKGVHVKRNNDHNIDRTDDEGYNTHDASIDAKSRQKTKSPSLHLLSIVSDALQQAPPTRKLIFSSISQDDGDGDGEYSCSNSDHSLEDLLDEEDPILSMIRNNNNNNRKQPENPTNLAIPTITSVKIAKKSSNRFMEDLDRRLHTPENQYKTVENIQQQETNQPQPPKNIVGFFNRIIRRGHNNDSVAKVPMPSAPLTREKAPKLKLAIANEIEDKFEITTSASVMDDEDFEQLEQLIGGSSPIILKIMTENGNFLFIGFTLFLAVFVYFYTRKDMEDDVT